MIYAIIIMGFGVVGVGLVGTLFKYRREVENIYKSVHVYLQKRHDILPELLEIIGHTVPEVSDKIQIIDGLHRKAIKETKDINERVRHENRLTKKVNELITLVENDERLKQHSHFIELLVEWNNLEEKLIASRKAYNNAVDDYNHFLEIFPTNLLGKIMKHERRKMFTVEEAEKITPHYED